MKKVFILGVMLIMCLGILAGCGPKKHGEFYTLEEAYEQGFLDVEDLKNIAYYQNGQSDDFNFEPKDKDPEFLSEATEKAIKETAAFKLREESQENDRQKKATAKHIIIRQYYGDYHGYIAIRLENQFEGYLSVITTETIGGVKFIYMNSNTIKIWKKS